ncbi:sensor histidine kinase [Heyndrickxia ginsengihumi]|uniref:sensor histidine kinase n=1 Tax=Heyndrickxia ginsengihumi TaxID=363870 RepID=UPI003D223241
MEFRVILCKLALIFFIAFSCIRADAKHISFIVFAILLYFCINTSIYLFHNSMIKRGLLLISIAISIVSYLYIQTIFIVLMPLTLIEILSTVTENKWTILIISFLPIIYIQPEVQPIYSLVACLCMIMFTIVTFFNQRMIKSENKIDQMRKSIQTLTKSLNENDEYIKQSEYTFKLEERNRISQEIHDRIGHSMTGALIQMEAAKRLMNIDQNKATELLENAIQISKDGIESIRLTLKNMKPPTEQVGIHRLKLFIDEFSTKNDLETTLTHGNNIDIISPIQWKIIHENVTEALTNARKYSDANRVYVDITVLNKVIKVEVKDNGKGAAKIKKGLGILGMEERTASIHGKIIVDGTHGFSVTTLLPIQS